jgi:hypothetical protein
MCMGGTPSPYACHAMAAAAFLVEVVTLYLVASKAVYLSRRRRTYNQSLDTPCFGRLLAAPLRLP